MQYIPVNPARGTVSKNNFMLLSVNILCVACIIRALTKIEIPRFIGISFMFYLISIVSISCMFFMKGVMTMEKITYKQGISGKEITGYFFAIGFPATVLILSLIIVSYFAQFGQKLMAPMVALMWICGAICALILPSHRQGIITETHWAIVGYLIGMFGLQKIVQLVSGTTNEMLVATYEQAMPAASNASLTGFLEYMLWIVAVMVPIGFAVMEGKKIILFRRKVSKQKFFDQLRGIRDNQSVSKTGKGR